MRAYTKNDFVIFWCGGCKEEHTIDPKRWTWNGSLESPTFQPSVKVTSGHYCDHWKPGDNCWCTYYREHQDKDPHFKCVICHSFVTSGSIQYLADSTHHLAGQTVELENRY